VVTAQRLRIIVLGFVVRQPLGGMASCNLQYIVGLRQLGHDVYFVEDSDDYPECYDPRTTDTTTDPTYGLEFAARTFERADLSDRWAYHDAHTGRWFGPCADRIVDVCRSTDLLLNVGGANPIRPWLTDIPARAFIDLDPVFTQVRHLTDPAARSRALQHTAFFSIGENVGLAESSIPDDGLPWQPTRQPVVLDLWPVTRGSAEASFTTIMLWDSYPSVEHAGIRYGMKSASFAPYIDLPRRVGSVFDLAVGSASVPRALLTDKGWRLRDSSIETRDLVAYRRFIQDSKAEFSVAKEGYVATRSGWFSDRSVAYLASGRPVLLQETGFSDWLETGTGVVPFVTPDEALAGIEDINRRYSVHCRTARAIADEYFDGTKVLARLVDGAFTPQSSERTYVDHPSAVHR
jgi:hypothetical protein